MRHSNARYYCWLIVLQAVYGLQGNSIGMSKQPNYFFSIPFLVLTHLLGAQGSVGGRSTQGSQNARPRINLCVQGQALCSSGHLQVLVFQGKGQCHREGAREASESQGPGRSPPRFLKAHS